MTTPNKRYPGRPNYTGPKSGFFLLPFHAEILGRMPDIFARLETIDKTKPTNEIVWRRHCMVYVRPSELPPEVVKAYVGYIKAGGTGSGLHKALCHWWEVLITHSKQLTALLAKYVPDHTWNGKKLVFK